MRTIGIVMLAAAVAAVAGPAFAAEDVDTQNSTVGGTIPEICQIGIGGDLSGLLTLSQVEDASGETAYDAGYVESADNATTLTLDANKKWQLGVNYSGLGWTCPGTYDKAEADLKILIHSKTTGTIQGGFAALTSPTDTKVVMLDHTAGVSDNTVEIQTRVILSWTTDIPGAYSITLVYTMETVL